MTPFLVGLALGLAVIACGRVFLLASNVRRLRAEVDSIAQALGNLDSNFKERAE